MITEQNYVGRGTNATLTEQTAKIDRQTHFTTEKRQTLLAQSVIYTPSSAASQPGDLYVNPATGEIDNIWKPFPGLEWLYEISIDGNVRHIVTGKPVRTYMNKGFEILMTRVKVGNKCVRPSIHRALALAFIPNPNGYLWVQPKDKSKPMTHASNLQWAPKRFLGVRHVRVSSLTSQKQESGITSGSYNSYILDRMLDEKKLTASERKLAGIISALDDSMAPQLKNGARLIAVPVSPTNYDSLIGKVVAVAVKAKFFAYYLGRVVTITADEVVVSRDNSEWSDRTESRASVASIARVVSVLETPVY